jgi:hypothetical protein
MKSVFLLFTFSLSLWAQEICYSIYRPNIDQSLSRSMEVLEKLNKIDSQMAWMNRQIRKEGELSDTFLQRKINTDYEKIERSLLQGNVGAAQLQLSSVYRKVEASYLRVLHYNRFSKVLREAHQMGVVDIKLVANEGDILEYFSQKYLRDLNSLDDIKYILREIEDEVYKEARILGKYFQRYETYETNLTKLLKEDFCGEVCQKSVKELRKKASVLSEQNRNLIQDFVGAERRITLNKVRSVFNGNYDALLIARKRELLKEGVDLLRRFANKFNLMQKFVTYLGKNISPRFKPVYRLFKSIFDERYLQKHAKSVERIVQSDLSASQKYQLMKRETADLDEKLFWVDFSRINKSKYKNAWEEVKEVSRKKGLTDEVAKMENAQRIGEILGDPKRTNIRNAIRILTTLAIVGGAVAYFSFETEDDEDPDNPNSGGDVIDVPPNTVDTQVGDDINIIQNGDDVGSDDQDDDDVTVLIDYLSPTDEEIEKLLLDLSALDQAVESEKDSAKRP